MHHYSIIHHHTSPLYIIHRYPAYWLHAEREGDAESTYSTYHTNNSVHHTRPRTNSNMSMSELSMYTTHPNTHNTHLHNSASGSRNLYTTHTTSSPRGNGAHSVHNVQGVHSVLPEPNTFSAPWVYNVNPTVASALASHAAIGRF